MLKQSPDNADNNVERFIWKEYSLSDKIICTFKVQTNVTCCQHTKLIMPKASKNKKKMIKLKSVSVFNSLNNCFVNSPKYLLANPQNFHRSFKNQKCHLEASLLASSHYHQPWNNITHSYKHLYLQKECTIQ